MATVTGPLHSDSAAGSFAKVLTYQRSNKRNVVKRLSKPRNDQTPKEVGIRSMVYWLTKLWKTLSPTDQASWALLAASQNVSPYNAYFKANMQRWTDTYGPMTLYQTPPSAAYTPTLALTATGGDGHVTLSIAPTTILEHVNVTLNGPPPTPDCLGTYTLFGTNAGENSYRRALPTPYRLYHSDTAGGYWKLVAADNYTTAPPTWGKDAPINGNYSPIGGSGTPAVSAVVAQSESDASIAVAIFRSDSTITTPNRQFCRAVLSLDVNGEATWTDTNQVGGKASLIGGLPAGDYHYMALPLSLDGRTGTPTADTPATVT